MVNAIDSYVGVDEGPKSRLPKQKCMELEMSHHLVVMLRFEPIVPGEVLVPLCY